MLKIKDISRQIWSAFAIDPEIYRRDTGDPRRIEALDLAKGVAMLMLVALHTTVILPLCEHIAMPLFFFLSGVFFRDRGIHNQVVAKAYRLIVPFLVFNVLGMLYRFVELRYFSTETPHLDFVGALTASRIYNAPLWFLLAVYFDNLLFLVFYRLTRSWWLLAAFSVMSAVTAILLPEGINLLCLRQSLISMPFFYAGFLFYGKGGIEFLKNVGLRHIVAAVVVILASAAAMYLVQMHTLSFHNTKFEGNPLVFYIVSLLCVLAVLVLCFKIKWLPIISYMGTYSLIIVCIHILIVNFTLHIQLGIFGSGPVFYLLSLAVVVVASVWFVRPLRHLTPWAVGEKSRSAKHRH